MIAKRYSKQTADLTCIRSPLLFNITSCLVLSWINTSLIVSTKTELHKVRIYCKTVWIQSFWSMSVDFPVRMLLCFGELAFLSGMKINIMKQMFKPTSWKQREREQEGDLEENIFTFFSSLAHILSCLWVIQELNDSNNFLQTSQMDS